MTYWRCLRAPVQSAYGRLFAATKYLDGREGAMPASRDMTCSFTRVPSILLDLDTKPSDS
jgi:hypothetical protein